MRELRALSLIAYLAAGSALLAKIGRERSRLQWDDPPTAFRRLVVVTAWPLIVLHNWRALFRASRISPGESPGDEGV